MNGNVKLGRAAARSGEWAQHFSNPSCFEIYVNLFLSQENFQYVNSQLSKEINFEILFRNLRTCSILRNFTEKNFTYGGAL